MFTLACTLCLVGVSCYKTA